YLFRDEPIEVVGMAAARADDPRFGRVEEQLAAVMRFPRERLATFTVAFGAAATAYYKIIGEKGVLTLDPAYEYQGALTQELVVGDGKPKRKKFRSRDQIAPEISYFADCIGKGR